MYWGIYDEYTIRYLEPKGKKAVLIRILPPSYKKSGIPYEIYTLSKYTEVLELYFEDICEEPHKGFEDRFILFDEKIATQLIDFVLNHDFDEINVHCGSGISRSSAIMICISKIINRKDIEECIYKNEQLLPNKLVLDRFNNLKK